MAALGTAVELPTGRESLVDFPLTASIHDTNWNVLLQDQKSSRTNSKTNLVTEHNGLRSSRPSSKSQISFSARPSPAKEMPPQELDAGPVNYFPPRTQSALSRSRWNNDTSSQNTSKEARSETYHTAHGSDDYTDSTRSASTAGTSSVQDGQVYTISSANVNKEEPVSMPSPALTARSTASKKSVVPTSKYKRKPPSAVKSSLSRKSGVETPLDSPMSGYTHIIQSPTLAEMQASLPSELPSPFNNTSAAPSPSDAQVRQGQAPLQHAKSTASVRKARALHSHPSMPSMKADDTPALPALPEPSPRLSALRARKSFDVARSRPSLVDLQDPSPAPDAPLPDLPAGIPPLSRPGSSHASMQPQPPPGAHVRPGTSGSSVAPTLRRQDTNTQQQSHAEMANFMTSTSKIIFRRFHDVHVRLLLNLQDEISTLEKELAEIESGGDDLSVDHEARKIKILSELRRLLAEYDHLFSNWNLMQSSKADTKTRTELEQWLKRPNGKHDLTISETARDDIKWLQEHADDLSSVEIGVKKASSTTPHHEGSQASGRKETVVETTSEKFGAIGQHGLGIMNLNDSSDVKPDNVKGGSGGGLAALFASCAGKRK